MKVPGFLLLFATLAIPQQGPVPATIEGTVVDSRTAAPLADAEIRLSGDGPGAKSQSVRTDAAGRFVFGDIPPGTYRLETSHPDYLNQAYGIPVESPFRALPPPFRVSEGQRLQAPIRMLRAATISGRIYDSNRAPVANASVSPRVLQAQAIGPLVLRGIDPAAGVGDTNRISVKTNGLGEYRMTGVPPGEYYIGAAPSTNTGTRVASDNAATTYYPGFRHPDRAVAIKVTAGAEIIGIDFALETVPQLRISGRIVNPLVGAGREGNDYSYQFMLVPRNVRILDQFASTVPDHDPDAESFELRNVAPGIYDLFVIYSPRPTRPSPDANRLFSVGRAVTDVSDRDVEGVTVTVAPGVEIRGQVVLDESATSQLTDARTVFVGLQPADGLPLFYAPQLPRAGVAADGTFVLPNATPGRYFVTAPLNPRRNVYLAGARLGPRDILGQPFEIEAGTTDTLVLEISGQAGRIEGTVMDRNSRPAARARVVLVPPPEQRREMTMDKAVTTADMEGRFSVMGLRPAVYTAYAFASFEDQKWLDSEYMSQFGTYGVSISIERNQRVERDLQLIP